MTNRAELPYRLAVIGVGNMGGAMARRLLRLGWALNVCDLVPDRVRALQDLGARACANPAEAARDAAVSIVAVVDTPQCQAVLFGANGLTQDTAPGHVVLICPTLAPADVASMAQALQGGGIAVIEAPMSGGPQRAEDGSMSLILSGRDELLAEHTPLLEALAGHRHHISETIGDAAKTKLVNNLAAAIFLLGTAEVLALAQAMGLDPSATLAVMEQSSGQSWIGSDRMRRQLSGDLAPRAHLSLLTKDARLALEAAERTGFQGPLGGLTRDVFAKACALGLTDRDDGVLFKWLSGTLEPNPSDPT